MYTFKYNIKVATLLGLIKLVNYYNILGGKWMNFHYTVSDHGFFSAKPWWSKNPRKKLNSDPTLKKTRNWIVVLNLYICDSKKSKYIGHSYSIIYLVNRKKSSMAKDPKCPCSHDSKTALIKQTFLFDTALVMKNT